MKGSELFVNTCMIVKSPWLMIYFSELVIVVDLGLLASDTISYDVTSHTVFLLKSLLNQLCQTEIENAMAHILKPFRLV